MSNVAYVLFSDTKGYVSEDKETGYSFANKLCYAAMYDNAQIALGVAKYLPTFIKRHNVRVIQIGITSP
jgi:hypothetical protein